MIEISIIAPVNNDKAEDYTLCKDSVEAWFTVGGGIYGKIPLS